MDRCCDAFGGPATCKEQVLGFAAPSHDGCAFFDSCWSAWTEGSLMGLGLATAQWSSPRRYKGLWGVGAGRPDVRPARLPASEREVTMVTVGTYLRLNAGATGTFAPYSFLVKRHNVRRRSRRDAMHAITAQPAGSSIPASR